MGMVSLFVQRTKQAVMMNRGSNFRQQPSLEQGKNKNIGGNGSSGQQGVIIQGTWGAAPRGRDGV
jgi:hypothetical protein